MFQPEGASQRTCIVETEQGRFHVDPADQFVGRSLREGAYALDELAHAMAFVTGSSRVLVVGAHIGAIAIPLSRVCRELVALEPNPRTCASLRLNVQLNACGNVTVYEVAANDRPGPLQFVLNTHNSGGSKRMPLMHDPMYFYDDPEIVDVQGVPLDDCLTDHDFDLVFMDVEGSEYFAFLGMQDILARASTAIVEFLPHHLSHVAGITVTDFLRPIAPHFSSLIIPTLGIQCEPQAFLPVLEAMFDAGRSDPGIIFRKGQLL